MHKNIPNTLTQISGKISAEGINIENMLSKSKKDYAYTVIDYAGSLSADTIDAIKAIEGVIRIRVMEK